MTVDAVIVTYNNRDTIRACVEPLVRQRGVVVTVVDNASADDSLKALDGLPVRAIQSGRNAGFGAGCNIGAAAGDAPYILLLNPDAQPAESAVGRMAAVLDAEPGVAAVGPRLLEDDGTLMPSMRRYQRVGSVWARALYLHRVFRHARWANEIDQRPWRYEAAVDAEWISGACMLVRRVAWEAVGGFDDGFFLYCEDQDLCTRLTAAGWRVRYEPSATVAHRGGHSAPRSSLYAVLAQSRIRYARKHDGRVGAAVQRAGIAAEALTHAVLGAAARPAHARGHRAALRATLKRVPT